MAGGNVPPGLAPVFVAAGHQNHIPPEVLAGVASVETSFGANQGPSSTGARGYMQFMPPTAKQFPNHPMTNPRDAIFDAAKLLNEYGYQSNPTRAIGAYNGGPGNPQMGYANQVMSEAKRLAPQLSHINASAILAGVKAGASRTRMTPQTSTSTSFSGGQPDVTGSIIGALLNTKIDTSGKVSSGNLLGDAVSNLASGQYLTPRVANTHITTKQVPTTVFSNGAVGQEGLGDINPLHHFTLGRSDMGVDANAAPGTPILAPNTLRVVGIEPNWYKGQPLIMTQIIAGPNKGKRMYFAEQLTNLPKVGSVLQRGAVVARYAASGTGVEVGWGGPGFQTQAQATTGYHEGQVTPAGASYRNYLNHTR